MVFSGTSESSSTHEVLVDRRPDGGAECSSFASFQGAGTPLDSQASRSEARDDVEVHMHDDLPRARSVVLKKVVAVGSCRLPHSAGDSRQSSAQLGRIELRKLVNKGASALFGNDEGMTTAQGLDIEEGQHEVVFVYLVARDIPVEDLVENSYVKGSHNASILYPVGLFSGPAQEHRTAELSPENAGTCPLLETKNE